MIILLGIEMNIASNLGMYFIIFPSSLFLTAQSYSSSLTMDIEGHISDRCEIEFNYGNQIDISNKNQESLPFDLYCNQPFSVEILSHNGGLKLNHSSIDIIEKYTLEIEIKKTKTNFRSDSQELTNVNNISSFGVIPFSSHGEIRVTLEHGLLYSGHYQDTVEIDIIPSILSTVK